VRRPQEPPSEGLLGDLRGASNAHPAPAGKAPNKPLVVEAWCTSCFSWVMVSVVYLYSEKQTPSSEGTRGSLVAIRSVPWPIPTHYVPVAKWISWLPY
jgi:hypothetical protein